MPLESRLVVQRFQPFLLLLSTIDSLHQRIVLHLRRLEVFDLLIPILALALFRRGRRIDRIAFGRNVFLAKRFASAVVSVQDDPLSALLNSKKQRDADRAAMKERVAEELNEKMDTGITVNHALQAAVAARR